MRRSLAGALALVAALALALAAGALPGSSSRAVAQAPADVTVSDPGRVLTGTAVAMTITTTVPAASIAQVDYEVSPAAAETWTVATTGSLVPPFVAIFDTFSVPNDLYDLRAVVTDTAAVRHISAPLRDRLVANDVPVVTLADPGALLHGTIRLTATVPDPGLTPAQVVATVSFQHARTGTESWATIEQRSGPPFATNFDTRTVADGPHDFRVVVTSEAGDTLAALPVRGRPIDNTPPTAQMTSPGSQLSGLATLTATASDAGSGVSSVRFQRARAGTGAWIGVGSATRAPYARRVDTTGLPNGTYDFRVTAVDEAGNAFDSEPVRGIAISNAPQQPAPPSSIAGDVAPAHDVRLLGAVAGDPQHEVWAYGFTGAAPAAVGGTRLTYTSPGNQLVLLRHTDDGGWQIADVLRDATGAAAQLPADLLGGRIAGAMAPSGEAWIHISGAGLFHRAPGGQFRLDGAATQAVGARILDARFTRLTLHATSAGTAFGALTARTQTPAALAAPAPGGAAVSIGAALDYAVLEAGAWTRATAALPASYAPVAGDTLTLSAADSDAPGSGWGVLSLVRGGASHGPLLLGRFRATTWSFAPTGLDALDLTGPFGDPALSLNASVSKLTAEGANVWLDALVVTARPRGTAITSPVVIRVDGATGLAAESWCEVPGRGGSCDQPLDLDHPAIVPDAFTAGPAGPVAIGLGKGFIHTFSRGDWSRAAAPGFSSAVFTGAGHGWLAGNSVVGRWATDQPSTPLASWPISNRSPLTGVAVPRGGGAGVDESGALAVGLDGTTLRYDAGAGWLIEPAPPRARHINLLGVAFAGPSSAFAVGQFGAILHWDGKAWEEDPQSISLTQSRLNAVAFAPSGEGWAVGVDGTILRYDGSSWSVERPPPEDETVALTSVTVAGSEVLAVAGGHLIERVGGAWRRVPAADLPSSPAPRPGDLRVVSGLDDGGVVAAGRNVAIVRQRAGGSFEHTSQPLEGIAVALAATRDGGGQVRAFVSLARPAINPLDPQFNLGLDVAGYPPGDGELLRQTGTGWQDLSRAQYPGDRLSLPGDGAVKHDPVLAIATEPAGRHAWVAGGYAGTLDGPGLGTSTILPGRAAAWRTASIWRYDSGGGVPSPALSSAALSLPASPGAVSFAFFSSALCRVQCSAAQDAQPDVNLEAAARQIAQFAGEPGGPSFAVLGGNARGPSDVNAFAAGNGAADLFRLPGVLAPLGRLPLYAALGPLDLVPGRSDPVQPWADAFANAPAPFGGGGAPGGISPGGSGGLVRGVHRHYAFDATQNGGTLRVIVLDNSRGTLEDSVPGQTGWLSDQLAAAAQTGLPVVAVASRPLGTSGDVARDGSATAAMLARAGVLAVFTTNGRDISQQLNERRLVPEDAGPGEPQIPAYEGASLGYQQAQNNGVIWYDVTVDTAARSVEVDAIPIVESLSMRPLDGLTVRRSATIAFEAVARRPRGTLATRPNQDNGNFPGIDNYVAIPAPGCGSRPCVQPTYAFRSADPTIGDFVAPTGSGSRAPRLDGAGRPVRSSSSGLFCAFNAGETTVTVTTGLLAYSQRVTVAAGGFGRPCGTVERAGVRPVVVVKRARTAASGQPGGRAAPPAAPPAKTPATKSLPVDVPIPAQAPAPAPAPQPAPTPAPVPAEAPALPPVVAIAPLPVPPILIVPPLVPPVQPIPPGGAPVSASSPSQSPAAARRKEKATKTAQQSAYSIRPAGTSGEEFFYGGVGVTSLLAMLLCGAAAGLLRRAPKPAYAQIRAASGRRSPPR